jgi:hypothetical protein
MNREELKEESNNVGSLPDDMKFWIPLDWIFRKIWKWFRK